MTLDIPACRAEIERLTAWVDSRDDGRRWWLSIVGFVVGWAIVITPVSALQLWFFPATLSARLGFLLPMALSLGVIFAIESQPRFPRPLVARFAPGASLKRRRTR